MVRNEILTFSAVIAHRLCFSFFISNVSSTQSKAFLKSKKIMAVVSFFMFNTLKFACFSSVFTKAVRFWSCPLSRSRGRIIPHQPCDAEVGTNMWKNISVGGTRIHDLKIQGLMLYQLKRSLENCPFLVCRDITSIRSI